MKKLIGILITATSIGTSPALAQSFDPDNGTGNLVTATIVAPAPAAAESKIVTQSLGTDAFAMSARRKVDAAAAYNAEAGYPDSGNTGGGSAGYNEMLRNW
jgi:hypothetical protein